MYSWELSMSCLRLPLCVSFLLVFRAWFMRTFSLFPSRHVPLIIRALIGRLIAHVFVQPMYLFPNRFIMIHRLAQVRWLVLKWSLTTAVRLRIGRVAWTLRDWLLKVRFWYSSCDESRFRWNKSLVSRPSIIDRNRGTPSLRKVVAWLQVRVVSKTGL